MKYFVVLLLALMTSNAWAGPASYKGKGGQIEAYGMVWGTYSAALAVIEICGENPSYKSESEETARNYLHANQTLFNKLGSKLRELAIQNGGEEERLRLKAELRNAGDTFGKQAREEMKKQVVNNTPA